MHNDNQSLKFANARVLKMGGAGDSPAPVGDPPTGTALSHVARRPFSLPRSVVSVPSGGSPDGTGRSPVLPGNYFANSFPARRNTAFRMNSELRFRWPKFAHASIHVFIFCVSPSAQYATARC